MQTVHDAIYQIREIRDRIIETQRFKGYSGRARFLGGVLAMSVALVMNMSWYPHRVRVHIAGWVIVAFISFAGNYLALIIWYVRTYGNMRNARQLLPALDAFPPMIVCAVLTLAMMMNGTTQYLVGMWMCLYGLVNLSSKHVLPKSIWPLGLYYILCGAVCLRLKVDVTNPLPMGIVFLTGETWGGLIFFKNRFPKAGITDFIILDDREGVYDGKEE